MSSRELRWALAERLGDDLFVLSEGAGTKHAFLTAVLATVLGGLILAFLHGMVDVENSGKRAGETIQRVLDIARTNTVASESLFVAESDNLLIEIANLPKNDRIHRIENAKLALFNLLVEAGIADSAAERIADSIVDTVSDAIDSTN